MSETAPRARVVLIGCGNQANRAIYPCVTASGIFDVLAACDLDEAKAKATARRTGAPRTYTDLDAALDEARPDGVFVIGPPAMQGALAERILPRGLPVFTEKPTGTTIAQGRRLVDLARQHGSWGMTGFMKRFNDAYRAAKECLTRPDFGTPRFIEKHFYAQNPHRREGQSDADLLWAVLIAQGVHALDLVRYFMGDVARLRGQTVFGANGTCAISATAEFVGGAIGTVQINTMAGPGNARYLVDVLGDGKAHVRVEDMRRLTYHPGPGAAWSDTKGSEQLQQSFALEPHPLARRLWTLGHYGDVLAFGEALRAGAPPAAPAATLEDNLAVLQACRAVWRSCQEDGRWVEPATVED